jgi:hypothetical protein
MNYWNSHAQPVPFKQAKLLADRNELFGIERVTYDLFEKGILPKQNVGQFARYVLWVGTDMIHDYHNPVHCTAHKSCFERPDHCKTHEVCQKSAKEIEGRWYPESSASQGNLTPVKSWK